MHGWVDASNFGDGQSKVEIHWLEKNDLIGEALVNVERPDLLTAGIETTLVSAEFLQGCNRMDLVITTSEHSKKSFIDTVFDKMDEKTKQKVGELRMTKPMEVLFEGVDTNIFKKVTKFSKDFESEMKEIPEKFLFLYTGHWLQGKLGEDRKDTGMLVKVFSETFKDMKNSPGLIMKTSGASFSVIDREEMLGKIRQIQKTVKAKTLPSIYLFHGDMTDEEMNEIYNHPKVKAHVNLTHGEGFGRPLLEASLSGKLVIASGWSGQLDFLSKELSILIGGSLGKVPKSSFPKEMYVDGSEWFTANYNEFSSVLREVYTNYKKYTLNSTKLSKVNLSRFSLKKMTSELGKILDKYVVEAPKEVKLKLPKLKKVDEKSEPKKITLPKLKKVT